MFELPKKVAGSGARSTVKIGLIAAAAFVAPVCTAQEQTIVRIASEQAGARMTFLEEIADAVAIGTSTDHVILQRLLGVSDTSGAAANKRSSDKSQPVLQSILVVEADPYYERWQKDANERLKQEKATLTSKTHPLAASNPDKSVVVCEAGCRTKEDEIVYIATAYSAVTEQAKFTPSSSSSTTGETIEPLDKDSVPCIAGCYGPPPVSHRMVEKPKAASIEQAPVVASEPRRPAHPYRIRAAKGRTQFAVNGAIVGPVRVARVKAIRNPLARRIAAKVRAAKFAPVIDAWHTKVTRAVGAPSASPAVAGTVKASTPKTRRAHSAAVITAAKHTAWRHGKSRKLALR